MIHELTNIELDFKWRLQSLQTEDGKPARIPVEIQVSRRRSLQILRAGEYRAPAVRLPAVRIAIN